MIKAIRTCSADVLQYGIVDRLSEEEARVLLRDHTKLLVAFYEESYVIMWLGMDGKFYGLYQDHLKHILSSTYKDVRKLAGGLTNNDVDNIKKHRRVQICATGGWMLIFNAPESVGLKYIRVYDLEVTTKDQFSSLIVP